MEIVKASYTLRGWRLEDVPSLPLSANDIRIWNNVRDFFPHPYTKADADAFIRMVMAKPCQQDFAIEIEGKAVGGIGFVPQGDVERVSAEIGYWLGEPYWGQGIMSDAVGAVAQHVFDHTEIIRLFAPVFEYNGASMRVLEKAGFKKTAVLRRAAIKNGQVIDLHYYERLK